MPIRPKSICRHPGCGKAIARPGYCDKHIDDAKQWDDNRKAAFRQKRRALKTNSSEWRRLREMVLREKPLCADCLKENRIKEASVVDHIDGDATNNNRKNLQSLCASCHSKKTASEDGGFGNRRRYGGGAGQKSGTLVSDTRPPSSFCVRKFRGGGI